MKKFAAIALGIVTSAVLLVPATTAQAVDVGPAATGVKLKFVPRTTVTFTGRGCTKASKVTRGRQVAVYGAGATQLANTWNIELTVRKPGKGWSAPHIAAGPDYGSLNGPELPKLTFDTIAASKPGTYQVRARTVSVIQTTIWPDEPTPTVYGPWSATVRVKVTKKQLKKTQSLKSKQRCYSGI